MVDVEKWDRDGYAILDPFLSPPDLQAMVDAIGGLAHGAGVRNLLDEPYVREVARSTQVRGVVDRLLSPNAIAVRAILFDKSPDANWALGWHQDTKIAVDRKVDAPGYRFWSLKEGVTHVQPPTGVLQRQLAFRISLDPCGPENGSVKVLPGSHRDGLLTANAVKELFKGEAVHASLSAGGALLFSSLLLHASDRATVPARRRVLHIEYCDAELAPGIEWNWTA